jgi:hypothetical protein
MQFNSFIIILFIANWILEGKLKSKLHTTFSDPVSIIWILFFCLHAVGLLYSFCFGRGISTLETKLSLFFFPLALPSISLSERKYRYILFSFATACLTAAVMCFVHASALSIKTHNLEWYFYYKLSSLINIHPVYFALYVATSIWIFFYLFWMNKVKISRKFLLGLITTVLFLTFFIVLLGSKSIIGGFILISIAFLLHFFYRIRKIKKGILIIFSFFILLSGLIISVPDTRNRFADITHLDLDFLRQQKYEFNSPFNGLTLRLVMWRLSAELFERQLSWLWGVGTGDVQEYLNQKYQKYHLDAGGYLNFNAHNQFVETFIGIGLIGMAVLLGAFFLSIQRAIQQYNYLYLCFLSLFIIFCLTESSFCTQKGVVFFSFFNAIFAFHFKQPETNSLRS